MPTLIVIGSNEWANGQVRYVIAELKASYFKSLFVWGHCLRLVLLVKDELLEYGFTWQAKVVDHWIHWYMRSRRQFKGGSR